MIGQKQRYSECLPWLFGFLQPHILLGKFTSSMDLLSNLNVLGEYILDDKMLLLEKLKDLEIICPPNFSNCTSSSFDLFSFYEVS